MFGLNIAKAHIILAANAPAVVAAAKATTNIPIVMLGRQRPNWSRTCEESGAPRHQRDRHDGVCATIDWRATTNTQEHDSKSHEIAIVMNGNNANNTAQVARVRSEARDLGTEVLAVDIR